MANSTAIRLTNAALDEQDGDIILRGRLDPTTLDALQVDAYQREVLPASTINEIVEGFKQGSVPDIDLSMRGSRFTDKGEVYLLQDPVFIVDGLQRVTAAKLLRQRGGDPRLGAVVHFDKTRDWEEQRFRTLNMKRTRLSPNVLIRNLRSEYTVIASLHSLAHDDHDFPLRGRICWQQRNQRVDLITAMILCKVAGHQHAHLGPGRSSNMIEMVRGLEQIHHRVGRNQFRDNVRSFYEVVDEAFGLKTIAFNEGVVHLRYTFLSTLADVFSRHPVFWREKKFFVEKDLLQKLATFPVHDPTIKQLAGAGGKARDMLRSLMIDHLNHGKRSRRLVAREEIKTKK
jgi:hypothetical protein